MPLAIFQNIVGLLSSNGALCFMNNEFDCFRLKKIPRVYRNVKGDQLLPLFQCAINQCRNYRNILDSTGVFY